MALLLGKPIHKVSVLPNSQRLGQVEFTKANIRPSEDWLEREILISLAGIVAESNFAGFYSKQGATRDLRFVRQLAVSRAGQKRAERLEKRLFDKAEHLLLKPENWQAVELIATELLQSSEISGRAATHLFDLARKAIQ